MNPPLKFNLGITPPAFAASAIFSLCFVGTSHADEISDVFSLSIEELFETKVTTASGVEESLVDAPAAMIVLRAADFEKRNYQSLTDILADLPGFDVIEANASAHITFYQRGYRTPSPTRTLIMINGVVDNHQWNQQAMLSRQYPVTNIKRVEVLYGPASVRYGPNAFSGIINVITHNADDLVSGEHQFKVRGETGSWNSRGAEFSARGNVDEFKYSLSARLFKSDEEDFSGRWGFLSNELYNDQDIWGPVRALSNDNVNLNRYYDPTDDWGLIGEAFYGDFKAGVIHWRIDEGYGTDYAADRGQANGDWKTQSRQYYLEHDWQVWDKMTITSFGLYRNSRVWGNWTEAEPDWNEGMEGFSFISFTNWNSTNDAYEFNQDIEYDLNDSVKLTGGWRYKRSDVTKAYDVPGYWSGSYSSTVPAQDTGPHGFGAGIFHSSDPVYTFDAHPLGTVPDDNRQTFNDKGIYLGTLYDADAWRFNVGVRYDNNSLWGSSVNPRLSSIYKFNQGKTAIKAIYGEAFQEPPAQQLYGGWSGRQANPDLKPEQATNFELILMHQAEHWLHDFSLYSASYSNVIREGALNDADRDIWGLEYRGRFEYPHFGDEQGVISGHFYYTYTKPQSNRAYDHSSSQWIDQNIRLGDIAPHKLNVSLHLPFTDSLGLNVKANYLSRTALYSRNPLSDQGIELGSRTTVDAALSFNYDQITTSLKVENLFNREQFAPGLKQADSGNDFTQRSKGYSNSLTPLPGRSLWLTLTYSF